MGEWFIRVMSNNCFVFLSSVLWVCWINETAMQLKRLKNGLMLHLLCLIWYELKFLFVSVWNSLALILVRITWRDVFWRWYGYIRSAGWLLVFLGESLKTVPCMTFELVQTTHCGSVYRSWMHNPVPMITYLSIFVVR